MKNKFLYWIFAVTALVACESDDLQDTINAINAPQDVDLTFNITQDNTGLVTITPTSQGATKYQLFFGDGSDESIEILQGESAQRVYPEGTYQVGVRAFSVNDKLTEVTKELTVSFRAPENLEITVDEDPNETFGIIVSATADFATMFEVDFGEDTNATPQPLAVDGTVNYQYASVGTYTVTVTAFSGGDATSTATATVEITDPLLLPIDFESPTLEYTFGDFEGAASAKVDNPDTNGNSSATVAQTLKTVGAQTFAGTVIQLDAPIDFSNFTKLRFKVRSPIANATVRVKLENATDPNIFAEVDAVTTEVDTWETLLYDFGAADLTQDYSKIILFFDFGNPGNGDTFFYDDIETTNQQAELLALPLTFESPVIEYSFTEFGGAPTTVVDNPQPAGLNITPKVGQTNKVSGAESFAGAFIDLEQDIDFDNFSQLSMNVLSPKAGSVVNLKVENLDDPNFNREVSATTSATAGEWEQLTFDFSGIDTSVGYRRIVVFFDFLTPGVGDVYYFDNIRETDGTNPIELPLTFEDPGISYGFDNFGGGTTVVVDNPFSTGINTSSKVAQSTKAAAAQNFAGSLISTSEPINFGSFTKVKMKTYSPTAGIVVKLKFENATNPNLSVEVDAVNTVANGWEELTYDFSDLDLSQDYSKIVVFFDFGNNGTGTDVNYYFDEIILSN